MSGQPGATTDDVWRRALLAAQVLAVDPAGLGGIDLRAPAGIVRDRWLATLRALTRDVPLRRISSSADDARLFGDLDIAATLAAGRSVALRGVLAEADGGIVVIALAERLGATSVGRIASVLDRGTVDGSVPAAEPDPAHVSLVTLDEGEDDDERTAAALRDRMAITLDLRAIAPRDTGAGGDALFENAPSPCFDETRARISAAKTRLRRMHIDDKIIAALCGAALALGIDSARAPLHAVRVAKILAALDGRDDVTDGDAQQAAALVLAPRATQMPAPQQQDEADAPDSDTDEDADDADAASPDAETRPLDDVVLDAAQAAIPPHVLAQLEAGRAKTRRAQARGKAGARQSGAQRGRRLQPRAGLPRNDAKLDLVATLRAAAPWQRLRKADLTGRPIILREDLRIARFEERTSTTTIFLVDASGSAARERLAEAKGAVRLILADCYVRRDEVALLAFRGTSADLLLPPTRSLVRAERALAALPGGGGTPFATGLDATTLLALGEKRRGRTPVLVVMSDGRANVARDGSGGRPRAHEDAVASARAWRAGAFASVFIDTSPAPSSRADELAAEMHARYLPLPFADARGVEIAARAAIAAVPR